ncbi:MAG: 4-hydroxybutyrate--acetyl-CoA CoA transferase [Lachnospiraceae bacterium]|nr:4-hydroxybutyrate--acetyl-CoA CoA transferase [Lachnospiraceae bacterium]
MDFKELYNKKLMTAYEAAMLVEDGDSITTDLFLAEPKTLFEALNQRCQEDNIHNVRLGATLEVYPLLPLTDAKYKKNIQMENWFCGVLSRKPVNSDIADFVPSTYWDQPAVARAYKRYNTFMASVSPMDEHGYMSFGVTGSGCEVYTQTCEKIIVEVNKNMPYNLFGPKVHISQVAAVCEAEYPLMVAPKVPLDDLSMKIGGYIAEEVPDGACLQLGIGGIPDAVGMQLKNKKDLGIHTEMLTDSMIELIECGAVNNSKKKLYPGVSVATFAFGSKRIYDFCDKNPAMAILPVDWVNNPYVIAQNDNVVSINAALEVDLFGQVCAESIGSMRFSGSGGQLDYVRGATMSKGGLSYIAFPSTAMVKGADGQKHAVSKIVPTLTPGSLVTTGKNEVDMIVTEYGIARLRGRSLHERANALINIAAPEFRDELRAAAKKLNLFI